MAVKKVGSFNIHETPAINQNEFDVETYLNANWEKTKEAVNNNAEELMQAQKDISTLKEDNKTNKSSIDVLEKSNETINKSLENINTKDKEQDEDIKANKESIEELKAENLEIKVENERLRNDIKSIAVVGEESGENIHIEDSSNARCEIEIGGNQKQDTREGYNQLKNEGTTQTLNNVTITKKEDETLVVNGTATEDFTFSIKINIELEDGEQYKLSGCPNGGAEKKYALTINQYYENQSHFGQDYGDGVNFTYNGSLPINNNIYIRLFKGITYNNLIFKPMIVKGTEQKPYEQYGASPSIDYPSPVKSVGNNINYFDINSVTNTLIILESGNLYPNDSWRTTDFIEVKANIYTLSWESITDYFQCNIAFYDKDKKYLSYIQYTNRTFSNTFDVKNNAKYMRISYSVKSGGTSYTREKIKLETGNKRTEYSSYNCGSARVDFQNKNIAPILNLGTNWEYTDKGIKNTITSAEKEITKFKLKAGQTIKIGFKLFSKPSQDTTFTWYVNNVSNIISSFGHIDRTTFELNKIYTRTYTAEEECVIRSKMFGNANNDIFEFQMWAEYDNLTEYQRYEEQSYLVDVQQEMLEGDYLDLENEKEHHEWGKYIFTGDEDYNKSQTYSNEKYFCGYIPTPVATNIKVDGKGICNYFNNFGDYVQITDKECIRIWGQFQVRILASRLTENSAEAFKTWLKSKYDSGNPVVVYYPLATPVELDFTEAQKAVAKKIKSEAHTYKNITNISAESSEVNPTLNIKYLKDAETEHNKLQAQIDEIKQLLSTTETSALLVNNLEKDLRMEV